MIFLKTNTQNPLLSIPLPHPSRLEIWDILQGWGASGSLWGVEMLGSERMGRHWGWFHGFSSQAHRRTEA